jgi:protein-L-isoaspartate(D-aspartate) O-methyltransferase
MLAEVEATYAQTSGDTGLSRMSRAVHAAMGKVERHRLLDPAQAGAAYRNEALCIGGGQTISQPYIVALSADLLQIDSSSAVLDVGTGSGYQAAILAEMAGRVCSIEVLPDLGEKAEKRLEELGYGNVEIRIGDGYRGWAERAPFDGIVVTAAAPRVPEALVEQLKPGGRMVIPVGAPGEVQVLRLVTKKPDGSCEDRRILPVRFVPLVPAKP